MIDVKWKPKGVEEMTEFGDEKLTLQDILLIALLAAFAAVATSIYFLELLR